MRILLRNCIFLAAELGLDDILDDVAQQPAIRHRVLDSVPAYPLIHDYDLFRPYPNDPPPPFEILVIDDKRFITLDFDHTPAYPHLFGVMVRHGLLSLLV